jgi:cysteine desulfurase/selenocysteine lyase
VVAGAAYDPAMSFDVERARSLTPGCERVIHLNNAGAALSPEPVLETVIAHLRREAQVGGYEAAADAADAVAATYRSVAMLLGCDPDEIALVESSTTGWDAAFAAIPLGPGDTIITARAEYGSNAIAMLHAQQRRGVGIELIDDDEHGQVSIDDLRERITDDVKLIAMTHVPTSGGLVNPVADVGKIARDAGITFLLDACQSVGQLPVDVAEIGCDILAATGRKFLRGPRGTGFLYVRRQLADELVPYMLDSRSATWTSEREYEIAPGARRFESFEHSVATRLGLGVAIDHALSWGLDAIADRNRDLADRLRAGLSEIEGVAVHDKGLARCAIVTFTVDDRASADVVASLRLDDINTSVSSRSYAQFDMESRGLDEMVRASVHYYNTEEEIDRLLTAVRGLADRR